MNLMRERRIILCHAMPWLNRQLMTAAASISAKPIYCKKGKQRKLDKEVHPRKQMITKKLKAAVESPYFIFFHFNDVSKTEWNDLRFELGKQDIKITLFPNKLSAKVLEDTKYHNFKYLFKSSTASCYSNNNNNIKALLDVMKGFPKMQLLGGKVDNEILSRNQIVEHSKLPALDVLRGQLVQLLMQPAQNLAASLTQSQRQLSINLEQYVSQNK